MKVLGCYLLSPWSNCSCNGSRLCGVRKDSLAAKFEKRVERESNGVSRPAKNFAYFAAPHVLGLKLTRYPHVLFQCSRWWWYRCLA